MAKNILTERKWDACQKWRPMIQLLRPTISVRKRILYICAGLRCMWHLLYSDNSRKAVEVAEQYVDGRVSEEDAGHARWCAECPTFWLDFDSDYILRVGEYLPREDDGPREDQDSLDADVERLLAMGVFKREDIRPGNRSLGEREMQSRLINAAFIVYFMLGRLNEPSISDILHDCLVKSKEWPGGWLVREVFGNPFRPFVVDPSWLTWDGGTVSHLARGIYDESAFDRLPVMADALEDAGCDDRAALDHCRSAGPHVKGCWVVDAVLGLT